MKTASHLIPCLSLVLISLVSIPRSAAAPQVPAENLKLTAALERRNAAKAEYEAAQKEYDKIAKDASPPVAEPPVLQTDVAAQKLVAVLGEEGLDVSIRKSVKDKAQSALPALFQYTHPANGSDSWSADIGATLDFDIHSSEALRIGGDVFGEYHYNDAAGKLKDTVLAGGGLDWILGGEYEAQRFRTSLAYKSDNLVAGQGILVDAIYYLFVPNLGIGNFAGLEATGGLFEGRLTPFLGFQWEDTDGTTAAFANGDRISFRAGLGFEANLLPLYFSNRLAFSTNISYWNHFETSGAQSLYDENQCYLETALTYWFNTPKEPEKVKTGKLAKDDQHFGITAKYTWGDNPDEAEFDADVLTVGLSVKF